MARLPRPILYSLIGGGIRDLRLQGHIGLYFLCRLGLENSVLLLKTIQFLQPIIEVYDHQDKNEDHHKHGDAARIDGKPIHADILP